MDLVSWFPSLGSEQLGTLTVIASFLLLFAHGLTAYFVKEKVLLASYKCVGLFPPPSSLLAALPLLPCLPHFLLPLPFSPRPTFRPFPNKTKIDL